MTEVLLVTELIRTAEDATAKFLRDEIDEKQYREALASFGATPETLFSPVPALKTRLDDGFEKKIPDDLYFAAVPEPADTKALLKTAADKQKERDAATKAAEKAGPKVGV